MAKEIADLCNDPPEGIKIFPNDEDITDIQAQIEGPGTIWNCVHITYIQCSMTNLSYM